LQQLALPVNGPRQWRNNGFLRLEQSAPPDVFDRGLAYDDINDEAEEAGKNKTQAVGQAAKKEWMSEPPQPPPAANASQEQGGDPREKAQVIPTAKVFVGERVAK